MLDPLHAGIWSQPAAYLAKRREAAGAWADPWEISFPIGWCRTPRFRSVVRKPNAWRRSAGRWHVALRLTTAWRCFAPAGALRHHLSDRVAQARQLERRWLR